MRKFLLVSLMLAVWSGAAQAETIKAEVNGMVCSFCATGIEKSFKALPAVEDVKVDLDTKLVTVNTKKNETIDDTTCKKIITDAGYSVVSITREK